MAKHTTPTARVLRAAKEDRVVAMTWFLLDEEGDMFGHWAGKLQANHQRALFGEFMGKGTIHIDGARERIDHDVRCCFGTDSTTTRSIYWRDLPRS